MGFLSGSTETTVSLPDPSPVEQALSTVALQLGSFFGPQLQSLSSQVSNLTGSIASSFGLTPTFSEIEVPTFNFAQPSASPSLGLAGGSQSAGFAANDPSRFDREAVRSPSFNGSASPGAPQLIQGTTTVPSLSFANTDLQNIIDQLGQQVTLDTLTDFASLDVPDNIDSEIRDSLQRLIEGQRNAQNGIQRQLSNAESRIGGALGRLEAFTPENIERFIAQLENGAAPSDVERELVTQLITNLIELGEEDIDRVSEEQLRLIREEVGPSLGLARGDTPLIDRGQLVGREAVRSAGQLQRGLRAEEARILLQRPLERISLGLSAAVPADQLSLAALTSGLEGEVARGNLLVGGETGLHELQLRSNLGHLTGSTERDRLREASRQFQANLLQRQREFALTNVLAQARNRLDFLTGSTAAGASAAQIGLGFAGQGLSSAAANRRAAGTSTETESPGFLGLASGLGGLASGVGDLFSSGIFSNSEFKDDIIEIDETEALDMIEDIPIYSWRYKWDDEPHIGPMAEDFHEVTGLGDGLTIKTHDLLGLNIAAMRGLKKQISLGLAEIGNA